MKNTIAGANLVLASSVSLVAAAIMYRSGDVAIPMMFAGVQLILGLYFLFIAKDKPPKE